MYVYCCTYQHSPEDNHKTSFTEIVPDYSCAIVSNMGCQSSKCILLFSVLSAVPKLQRLLLIQEPVSPFDDSFDNHIQINPYLAGLHQSYMYKYRPVIFYVFIKWFFLGVNEASTGIVVVLNLHTFAVHNFVTLHTFCLKLVGHNRLIQTLLTLFFGT